MGYPSNSETDTTKFKYHTVYHMTVVFCGTFLAIIGGANGVQSPWISTSGIGIIVASVVLYTLTPLVKRLMKRDDKSNDVGTNGSRTAR